MNTEVPAQNAESARATREWPLPPMLEQLTQEAAGARVECRLLLAHGGRMAGELTRFEPGAGRLSVRAEGDNAESVLELDLLRSVALPVPVAMRPREVPLTERGAAVFPPSERQVFFVEFTDGEHLTGETMGHVLASCGLFLYEPVPEGGVVRLFYPKAALRGHRIGLPIGEMLVREHLVASADVQAAVDKQHDLRQRRIGDYLASELIVTRDQLETAILHQADRPLLRIGEALIQLGLINDAQLGAALARQAKDRSKPLGRILTEMGLVAEDQLREALARKLGIPFVGLADFNFDPVAVSLVGSRVARRRSLIPLCLHDGAIVVAFEDPLDTVAIEDVRFLTQRRVIPAMAAREEIVAAISAQYGNYGTGAKATPATEELNDRHEYEFHRASDVDVEMLAASLRVEDQALAFADDSQEVAESALVQLVNKMILDALQDGVSDIHVESVSGRARWTCPRPRDGPVQLRRRAAGRARAAASEVALPALPGAARAPGRRAGGAGRRVLRGNHAGTQGRTRPLARDGEAAPGAGLRPVRRNGPPRPPGDPRAAGDDAHLAPPRADAGAPARARARGAGGRHGEPQAGRDREGPRRADGHRERARGLPLAARGAAGG